MSPISLVAGAEASTAMLRKELRRFSTKKSRLSESAMYMFSWSASAVPPWQTPVPLPIATRFFTEIVQFSWALTLSSPQPIAATFSKAMFFEA